MSATNNTRPDMLVQMREAIQRNVREWVKEEYEKEKAALIERMDKAADREVTAIVIHMMRTMDMQVLNDRIVITLRKENVQNGL